MDQGFGQKIISFKKPDPALFLSVLLLAGLGVLVLASVSAAFSMEKFGVPNYYFNHQFFYGWLPGTLLGLVAFFIPLNKLKEAALPLFTVNLFLLILILFSQIGLRFFGASRWLDLGLFSFQPSEILKLAFILYLAAWFAKREKFGRGGVKETLPFLLVLILVGLLLALQPDVGTLGIVALVGVGVFFLSRSSWQQVFLLLGLGAVAFLGLILAAPYRLSRLLTFLNPDLDIVGQGYQLSQALIAAGSGGFFGLGLGFSRQKFGFLPQTIGDAIFPIFAEETGFLGAAILVLLFLFLFWRGLIVSAQARDSFSRLAGAGVSLWFVGQAFINIAALTNLLPLTGVPLPFISYGGSHLVAEMIGAGILLNISRQT
jgi:cell division protein FtsW